MRSGGLMWLLGAGASAAGGIPTAGDMIWEFKQQLYVSQRRGSINAVSDLANPAVRNALQSFIDGLERFPAPWARDEYAALFEAAYPSETDRRTYIAAKLAGGKPSYGHIALASLMKAGHTRLVWTTNFDPLVADACAKVYDGTGHLTTVALDAPALGQEVIASERWPAEIKLHGDFRSRRLKNTSDELREQDATLREGLVSMCGRAGLVVAGYSGRDDSVMESLEAALQLPTPFPGGLFWLQRGDSPPLPRVASLLQKATDKGVDGGLVEIENFDEALRDLIRLTPGVETSALDSFAASRSILTPVPRPSGRADFPVIRFNAVEVETTPTVCRRIVCTIGGQAEIAEAVGAAGVEVLATRVRAGVLAFGADSDVRKAFDPFGIEEFDLHPIEVRRLRYESQEQGLLRQALSLGLARAHGLERMRRRSADLLFPADPTDSRWSGLRTLVNAINGKVPDRPEVSWHEGVSVRLAWAGDRLWLLAEPRTVMVGVDNSNRDAATDFSRERTVRRYNKQLNDLISFWTSYLAGDGAELRALGVSAGVDAAFKLGTDTAFSRRIR
jgi:NAD-dependent SIR2 family protein deacetylase